MSSTGDDSRESQEELKMRFIKALEMKDSKDKFHRRDLAKKSTRASRKEVQKTTRMFRRKSGS